MQFMHETVVLIILNGSLLNERANHERKTKTKEKVINFGAAFVLEQDAFSDERDELHWWNPS